MSHESSDIYTISTMKGMLQDVLDELVSIRTSTARISEILSTLERLLADICSQLNAEAADRLRIFVSLQDSFECNVPSRILTWMSVFSSRLEYLTSKASLDHERQLEMAALSSQLIQSLFIIQGVALIHKASKEYLGRRYPLEVLLDLLLTSRHVSPMPLTTSTNTASNPSLPRAESSKSRSHSPNTSSVSLASAVLDTLLCIFVDSSPALRVFEELKGLQLVVKILKRAGTPREVRMKCLEFLYFYLLDETIPPHRTLSEAPTSPPTSPMHTPKSLHHRKPSESMSTDTSMSSHSSSSSFPVLSTTSFSLQSTPRSSSGFSSASTPTSPTSSSQRPVLAPSPRIVTPPNARVQPRSLLMLRKEVDYVPLSPKKAQISRLGFGGPRSGGATRAKLKQRGTVDVLSSEDTESDDVSQPARAIDAPRNRGVTVPEQSSPPIGGGKHRRAQSCTDVDDVQLPSGWASPAFAMSRDESEKSSARTMEEKKEFLGSMLGNVDALVEGVRKAGIWGLG